MTDQGASSGDWGRLGADQQPANYYAILGVPRTATAEEVRTAYRARVVACHPDHNPSPDAHEITTLVNEAWHVLGHPERRRLYDATLAAPEDTAARQASDAVGDTSAAERVPWSCSRCGRRVPRYVDQCRCGQRRPRATHRWAAAGVSRGPDAGNPRGGEGWWFRIARAAAAVLICQQCFFSPSPDVPPDEPAAVEAPAGSSPAYVPRVVTPLRTRAQDALAEARARSALIDERLRSEEQRQRRTGYRGVENEPPFVPPSPDWWRLQEQMRLEQDLARLAQERLEQQHRAHEQWERQQRLNQVRD